MKPFAAAVLLALMIFSLPASVFAVSPWKEQKGYLDQVAYKLDYGLLNFLGGWLEVVREPWRAVKARESFPNIAKAKARGWANALIYTAGGAVHAATFPITALDVPIPNNGVKAHKFPSQYPEEPKS